MADIHSKDEIDVGEQNVGAKGTPKRIVTSYDFKHPARVNKDQLRTLENLHDNFARLLSSTFSGAMRAVVDVDIAFVDQTTYAEFIMSLSNPSCSYQFTLGPTNGQAIIDFAMPVTFAFVDRIFGGKGSSQGVSARTLTPIEVGVIHRITKRVIEDLEATWEPILKVDVTDIELETNPEFMQITAASEIVILLAFEVNSTNASGLVSLCYPFFTLESILPRLGRQSYVRSSRTNKNELIQQNNLRLNKTFMPVTAELGRTCDFDLRAFEQPALLGVQVALHPERFLSRLRKPLELTEQLHQGFTLVRRRIFDRFLQRDHIYFASPEGAKNPLNIRRTEVHACCTFFIWAAIFGSSAMPRRVTSARVDPTFATSTPPVAITSPPTTLPPRSSAVRLRYELSAGSYPGVDDVTRNVDIPARDD